MELLGAILVSLLLISALGIVIAFSPTLVITELTILTRSKSPVVQSTAFIAGIGLAVSLFSLGALLLINPSNQITLPSTHDIIKSLPIADILAGSMLIFVSTRLLQAKLNETVRKHSFNPNKLLTAKALFWFGFIKMGTSLSSIAAIILAARYIMTSQHAGTLQFASVLWLTAVAVLPFILILLLQQYRPESFTKIQNVSDRALSLNWRRLVAFVFAAAGCYFVLAGTLNLS